MDVAVRRRRFLQLAGADCRHIPFPYTQTHILTHLVSEFVNEGLKAGLSAHRMGASHGPNDNLPRLLSILFELQSMGIAG